jgi:hypothetical protein
VIAANAGVPEEIRNSNRKIRNPKSETNSNIEIRNPGAPRTHFGHSDFEFVSDVEFRISDFSGKACGGPPRQILARRRTNAVMGDRKIATNATPAQVSKPRK